MGNRNHDRERWKRKYVMGLPQPYKLLWFYIEDDCDHAGIWIVDFDVAFIRVGGDIELDRARELFKKKIVELDGGEKWFMPGFISFHYPMGLNPENNFHKQVIGILKRYGLYKPNGDIKKVKAVGVKKFKKPTADQVTKHFQENGLPILEAQFKGKKFVAFYESKGWMIGKNKMIDWKAAVRSNWLDDNKSQGKKTLFHKGNSTIEEFLEAAKEKRIRDKDATVEDVRDIYESGYKIELGVKP